MSRGFVKEEDQENIPMIPPRADLPHGIQNYVTSFGYQMLLDEKEKLQVELNNVTSVHENERRIALNFINAKLLLLQERIATAKIIDLSIQPKDEVRFGAIVSLEINDQKKTQTYQIVGVDEANIAKGKISFISPIAKLLLNKKVGEKALLKLSSNERIFKILSIAYA